MANIVTVILDLDENTFEKKVSKIEKNSASSGSKIGDNFSKGFGKSLGNIGSIALKALGPLSALFAGKKIIDAAAEQERAINGLNASLKRIGEFSSSTSKDLQLFASNLQRNTVFGDELLLSQLALAQGFGATAAQSKQIVAAATDLSAALGISLESAVRNISKTLGGLTGELGEVVPELKTFTQEQLKSGAAIELVANKFKGLAGQEIQTFDGSLKQLSNSFGDLLESFGSIITESSLTGKAIAGLSNIISNAATKINNTFNADPITKVDLEIQKLEKSILALQDGTAKFKGISTFGNEQLQVRKLGDQLVILKKQREDLVAQQAKEDAIAAKNNAAIQANKASVSQLAAELTKLGFTQQQVALATTNLGTVLQTTNDTSLLASLESIKQLGLSASELKRTLTDPELLEGAVASTQTISASFSGLGDAIEFSAKRINVTNKTIADSFVNGLAKGVGSAFSKVGASLASGENAFKAFGDAVIGEFGSLLGDLGQGFILQGTARLLAGDPGAGALIGAGAALKIFGAFLGAKSGAGATGGGGGGGTATGGGVSIGPTNDTVPRDTINTEPRTAVNLTIQGDVLDSDESGSRILDLLNKNFDTKGGVVSRNARFA